jgi:hypothetical protein
MVKTDQRISTPERVESLPASKSGVDDLPSSSYDWPSLYPLSDTQEQSLDECE